MIHEAKRVAPEAVGKGDESSVIEKSACNFYRVHHQLLIYDMLIFTSCVHHIYTFDHQQFPCITRQLPIRG